ncbi:MAG: hypothetical protein ACJ8BW_26510, partial [Ktedonobacteraceae bacterium]
ISWASLADWPLNADAILMMQKIEWPGNLVIESGVEHPFVASSILKGAVTTYPYLLVIKLYI